MYHNDSDIQCNTAMLYGQRHNIHGHFSTGKGHNFRGFSILAIVYTHTEHHGNTQHHGNINFLPQETRNPFQSQKSRL